MSPSPQNCKWCAEPLRKGAHVCAACGRPQAWWKVHHLELTSLLSLLIALGLLILGSLQYRAAHIDKVKAANALARAEQAVIGIDKIIKDQQDRAQEANASFAQLFGDICRAFDGSFDLSSSSCVLANGAMIRYMPTFSE